MYTPLTSKRKVRSSSLLLKARDCICCFCKSAVHFDVVCSDGLFITSEQEEPLAAAAFRLLRHPDERGTFGAQATSRPRGGNLRRRHGRVPVGKQEDSPWRRGSSASPKFAEGRRLQILNDIRFRSSPPERAAIRVAMRSARKIRGWRPHRLTAQSLTSERVANATGQVRAAASRNPVPNRSRNSGRAVGMRARRSAATRSPGPARFRGWRE